MPAIADDVDPMKELSMENIIEPVRIECRLSLIDNIIRQIESKQQHSIVLLAPITDEQQFMLRWRGLTQ